MFDWLDEAEGRGARAAFVAALAAFWYICVFGFWLVPAAARLAVQDALSASLARRAVIERVTFNPFKFEVGVYGLRVFDPDGKAELFSLAAFVADFEPSRALSGVIAVKDILIDAPTVRLARESDGRLNVADLLAPGPSEQAAPDKAEFELALPPGLRLEVANLLLRGGKAVFADEARGVTHSLGDLHFYLPYFTSVDLSRRSVLETTSLVDSSKLTTRLVADFGGEWPRFELQATIRDVVLSRFADLAPVLSSLDARAESVSLSVEALFTGPGMPRLTADVDLAGIKVAGSDGAPFFAAKTLGVENAAYDFDTGAARVGRLALRGYELTATLLPDGSLKAPFAASSEPAAAKTQPAAEPAPANTPAASSASGPALPNLNLARLTLDDGKLRLTRQGEDKPAVDVTQADVSGWGINLADGTLDQMDVYLKSNLCPKLWLRVGGKLATRSGYGYFALDGCDAGRIAALAPAQSGLPQVAAKASLSGSLAVSPGPGKPDQPGEPAVTLTKGRIEIKDVKVSGAGSAQPALSFDQLVVDGIEAAYPARTVSLARLSLAGGGANLVLDAGGGASLAGLGPKPGQAGQAQAKTASGSPPPRQAAGKAALGTLRAPDVSVTNFAVNASGGPLKEPVTARIERLSVKNAAYPPASPVTVETACDLGALGRLEASVEVAPELDKARGKLATGALSLPALAQFAPPLPLAIGGGTLKIDGAFDVAKPSSGEPVAAFEGDLKLASLSVLSPGGVRDLWLRSLTVSKLRAKTSPLSVAAESVDIEGLSTRAERAKDGRILAAGLEIAHAAPAEAKPAAAQAKQEQGQATQPVQIAQSGQSNQSGQPAKSGQTGQPAFDLPVTLGSLRLTGAKLDFTDQSVDPPFKANLALDATLRGLAPKKPLNLDFGAVVNGAGRIKAAGTFFPPPGALEFEMKASIDNLDLAEGSPYSKRFTGFPITTGKFGLAGDYKLTGGQLNLQNKIKVSNIRIGQKAPDAAAAVPLDLAVSLLADSSGNIELDIPVTGDLSAVKVDLGQAISKAISGVMARVLLGPFAFFTAGGKTGQAMPLPFAPGSAQVAGEAAERLADLAKALANKPKATVEVTGYADAAAEPEGIKRYALHAKVAESVGRTGQLLSDADYARFLARYYARANNGKKGGTVAEMETELLPGFTLGPEETKALAKRRAVSVRDFLVSQGVNEANIFLIAPDAPAPKHIDGVPNTRADLTLKR